MTGVYIWDEYGDDEISYQPAVAGERCRCDRCEANNRICLLFDTSAGEYEPRRLCFFCLAELAEITLRLVR